jgi:hypothetical protein
MSIMQAVLVAVALGNAGDALRYGPDYLAYFNFFVKPADSWKLATDSNLDWGQGLIALRHYEQSHPNEQVHLAYFGDVPPSLYGIRALPLGENQRVTGTVVISATNMSGQYLDNPEAYHWLLSYPRKAVLAHSLYVFEVPEDRPSSDR